MHPGQRRRRRPAPARPRRTPGRSSTPELAGQRDGQLDPHRVERVVAQVVARAAPRPRPPRVVAGHRRTRPSPVVGLAGRDRPGRVGDPVAPRPDVERRRRSTRPRCSASTVWAAVTPDPQYAPTGAAGRPRPRRTARAARRRPAAGRRAATSSAGGRLTAPGMCPATGSIGSVSPRKRGAGPGVEQHAACRASAAAPSASSTGSSPGATVMSPGRRLGARPARPAGPARSRPAKPPSSTRTVGVAGPAQRPPEPGRGHAVAAVVDDHRRARRGRRPRRSAACSAAGSGSGCRPPAPGGPHSSASRSTKTAPGHVAGDVARPGRAGRPAASGRRAGSADRARPARRARLGTSMSVTAPVNHHGRDARVHAPWRAAPAPSRIAPAISRVGDRRRVGGRG